MQITKLFIILKLANDNVGCKSISFYGYSKNKEDMIEKWIYQLGDDCHYNVRKTHLALLEVDGGWWGRGSGLEPV